MNEQAPLSEADRDKLLAGEITTTQEMTLEEAQRRYPSAIIIDMRTPENESAARGLMERHRLLEAAVLAERERCAKIADCFGCDFSCDLSGLAAKIRGGE